MGYGFFLRFLHSSGITKENLSVALPEMIARRKPIREGFSGSDVETLFDHIDKSTSIGKRDYAIMMLALQTGLRACDIADLKRRDINWRTKEICIAQTKTGRALTLYLPPESGNAIADYILNVRPKCGTTNVFLCKDRPFRPRSNRSVSSIVSRYMQKSGVAESPIPRRGFHSFRRTFGKQLLESETSLDMLNELLGHFHMDSSRPYIAIDEEGLKKCCLNLIDIKKERDDS
jgi:integrase